MNRARAAIVGATLASVGCSAMLVKPARTNPDGVLKSAGCTTGVTPPVIDTLVWLLFAAQTGAILVTPTGTDRSVNVGGLLVSGATTVTFLGSSAYGFNAVSTCKQVRADEEEAAPVRPPAKLRLRDLTAPPMPPPLRPAGTAAVAPADGGQTPDAGAVEVPAPPPPRPAAPAVPQRTDDE